MCIFLDVGGIKVCRQRTNTTDTLTAQERFTCHNASGSIRVQRSRLAPRQFLAEQLATRWSSEARVDGYERASAKQRTANFLISVVMLPTSEAAMYAKEHPDSTTLLPNGKIRFIQTGMEFPANVQTSALKAYVDGKAFRRAVAKKINDAYEFDQHVPYIIPHPHKDKKHFLYCTLTGCTLPRSRDVLVNHTNGKRFKRRFQEAEKKRLEREQRELKKKQKKKKKKKKKKKTEGGAEGGNKDDEPMDDGTKENDVLDGILSSDDESADSSDDEGEGKEEDETFWTRGKQRTEAPSDEDQIMEDEDDFQREQKGQQEGSKSNSENNLSLLSIKQRARKRQREKMKLQKKVRRDAQRRKRDAMQS
ncbi:Surfeit locus protein 2 [Gracilariopsis chorda]|uniref:Surfeit locus protein 2 n=1 Tax=Gracilariopsis chorda TaxID=448386 RepID=A0A2V3IX06_9FLOR|nr:Surfeit locus protein 2 [Gracilariopsis chorda]|eukprot:PXF46672.1 Surfeit locus protein 2 [Gracilariopsis chorda]